MAACPQCKGPVGPRAETPSWPFCCERCRLIDLGAWLDERYRIPGETAPDGEDSRDPPPAKD